MKNTAWIVVGAALLGFLQPAVADLHASPDKVVREGLFRGLLGRQYFKIASCKDFSNLILEQNGLPWLGEDGMVDGLRSNVDRRNEKKSPPVFMDSLQQQIGAQNSVEITAAGDREHWTLTLNRDVKISTPGRPASRLKLRTAYRFTVMEKENLGSCELLDLSFHVETNGARAFDQKFGLDSCLDLFLKGKPESQGTTNASKVAIEYLFHDCSIGMHYSLEAKHTAASVR